MHSFKCQYLDFIPLAGEDLRQILEEVTEETQRIQLIQTGIPYSAIHYFQFQKFQRLEALMLFGNEIGDRGCKYITKLRLPNIKELGVGNNKVSSIGCLHLCKGRWTELTKLEIQANELTVGCMRPLISGNWKNLALLLLSQNKLQLSELTIAMLQECSANIKFRAKRSVLSSWLQGKLPTFNQLDYRTT